MKKTILLLFAVFLLIPNIANAEQTKQFKAEISAIRNELIQAKDKNGDLFQIEKDIEIINLNELNVGDKVVVEEIKSNGEENKYIVSGFVRDGWIYFLIFIFIFTVWIVNGKKGFRLIINLAITLGIIFFIIIPLILRGWPPVFTTVIGGTLAMIWSIYFSHGITKKSNTAILGIVISLFVVGILSWIFVKLASLTGLADEEAGVIIGLGYNMINMRGLLLAAIMIGSLGVLDDLAISQVSAVQELKKANPKMKIKELFQASFRIGHDHTGAVVNTLALAYVGASFPLAILLTLRQAPFDTIASALNNEVVATEIVRTLIGSIGILLSMPICTIIAVKKFSKGYIEKNKRI